MRVFAPMLYPRSRPCASHFVYPAVAPFGVLLNCFLLRGSVGASAHTTPVALTQIGGWHTLLDKKHHGRGAMGLRIGKEGGLQARRQQGSLFKLRLTGHCASSDTKGLPWTVDLWCRCRIHFDEASLKSIGTSRSAKRCSRT